jgi:hypothetical protein
VLGDRSAPSRIEDRGRDLAEPVVPAVRGVVVNSDLGGDAVLGSSSTNVRAVQYGY